MKLCTGRSYTFKLHAETCGADVVRKERMKSVHTSCAIDSSSSEGSEPHKSICAVNIRIQVREHLVHSISLDSKVIMHRLAGASTGTVATHSILSMQPEFQEACSDCNYIKKGFPWKMLSVVRRWYIQDVLKALAH